MCNCCPVYDAQPDFNGAPTRPSTPVKPKEARMKRKQRVDPAVMAVAVKVFVKGKMNEPKDKQN